MKKWLLDIDTWPGPDRRKWAGLRDIMRESPGGAHLAVVYSCAEAGVGKEIGMFALLAGPPDSPRLLVRPRGFKCWAYLDDSTIVWIGERYCAVRPYVVRMRLFEAPAIVPTGRAYFDVERRKVAYGADIRRGDLRNDLPDGLVWRDWRWLALGPKRLKMP